MSNVVGPFPQRKRVRRYRRLLEEQRIAQEDEYVERRFATRIARFDAVQRVGCCKKNCLKPVDRSEVEKQIEDLLSKYVAPSSLLFKLLLLPRNTTT